MKIALAMLSLNAAMLSLTAGFRATRPRILSTLSAISARATNESPKVKRLQQALTQLGIDAFIVPTDDPHMSEYTAPFYNRREFISGFTGSAGTAIITSSSAVLFTDGRYFTQAENELSTEWKLMRQGMKDVPTPSEYLLTALNHNAIVGIDPFLHSAESMEKLQKALMDGKNITIKNLSKNPIDSIWTEDRPAPPLGAVRVHPLKYAGKSVRQKLLDLRSAMAENSVGHLVSAALDEIAWMYNLRGADVPCNPVTVSYAVVGEDSAHLFIDERKLGSDMRAHLKDSEVTIHPYEAILPFLESTAKSRSLKVWMDPKTTNFALFSSVPANLRVEKPSPIVLMKACKNSAELAGMRACHIRDGAAESHFLSWLSEELLLRDISEVEVDERITAFRAEYSPSGTETAFLEPSFPTIAGVNSNGAIVHYRAVKETCKQLTKKDMMLLDSGGQYIDGTTDVTRTFHFGEPTDYQRNVFTRVLKGNIAVDSRVFPEGTPGVMIDAYAREHLWAIGKDFIHGVGHGVGAALNVHEGPCSISRVLNANSLKPGMVISNEPGYYETGKFGIRIENLLVVVQKPELGEFAGKGFLGFEKLTMIPIQKKLINVSLLTPAEISWINDYHAKVRDNVGPLLRSKEAKTWLSDATSPI